jgi:hypothetical protein
LGPEAEVEARPALVRSSPESGHSPTRQPRPLRANSGSRGRGLFSINSPVPRDGGVTLEIPRFRNAAFVGRLLAIASRHLMHDAVSDPGRSSEASLRYEEAKLLSRGSVDEQDGGMIGRITFLYDIRWDGFPLAIFQVLPLV